MKKINKAMATVVAAIVAMNAMMVPAMAEDRFVPTEDGSYTTSAVDVYNASNPDALSGSNGIFADEAEVTISGDWATLVVYACNPLPNYPGVADGLLTKNSIAYGDETYVGTITSIGYNNTDAIVKKYSTGAASYGVIAGESYTSDAIEFTIPTAALAEKVSLTGTLYLNMGHMIYDREHTYLLDLIFVNDETTSHTMEITATVPANVSSYAVTIPESAEMGTLSTTEDTSVNYEVTVDAGTVDKSITIETTGTTLADAAGSVELTLVNTFGTEGTATFDESGSATGSLMVAASDVAKIATDDAQNLTGSITFTITAE